MTKEQKHAIRERIWFLENEAKAMREEARKLRAQIAADRSALRAEREG